MTDQLSIDIGRVLRDVGMARTIEAEPEQWLAQALRELRRFSRMPEWAEFKMENFRYWYAAEGFPPPHDSHVWGAFTNLAAREGVIRFTGKFTASASAKTHGHDVKVWTAA